MSDYSRRRVLQGGAAGAAALLVGAGGRAEAAGEPAGGAGAETAGLRLWYDEDAGTDWLRALPVGNGRLGAMVFGGVDGERLQLNEDTVWAGGPHDYANPKALAALPRIRQLVFEDR
jgi:alpha-L-fucosidase 2